jgi:GTP cyclohydrolase I
MSHPRTVCTYKLEIEATCPADPSVKDTYACTITTLRMIEVEKLLASIESIASAPIYQEDLTEAIGKALKAEVVTRGTHSGVHTTCSFYPEGHSL